MPSNPVLDEPSFEPVFVDPEPHDAPSPPGGAYKDGALGKFVLAAKELVDRLRQREEEFSRLLQITERVNYGVVLQDVLEFVYSEMRQVIPYNRIGFSLLSEDRTSVAARWTRSDRPLLLTLGYEAKLEGSTLEQIIATGRPRIINDLEGYLARKGTSDSTRLIVEEGMRSSLTCPLIVQGRPIGFIFFSSADKNTYFKLHVDFFQQIAGQLAAIVEKSRLYDELAEQKKLVEVQHQAMLCDLEMARLVQRALIPRETPTLEALDVAFAYEPAVQIGGDILDIVPLGSGRVLFFVGDAMGHGVQAALVMAAVKTALHAAIAADPRPDAVLSHIDRALQGLLEEQFVTAACCVVDPAAGKAQLALAGHPQAILHRSGQGASCHGSPAVPLGVMPDAEYQTVEFPFGPADALLLYSDALVEAFDGGREPYGLPRLMRVFARWAAKPAGALLEDIRRDLAHYCGPGPLADDLTILVAKSLAS